MPAEDANPTLPLPAHNGLPTAIPDDLASTWGHRHPGPAASPWIGALLTVAGVGRRSREGTVPTNAVFAVPSRSDRLAVGELVAAASVRSGARVVVALDDPRSVRELHTGMLSAGYPTRSGARTMAVRISTRLHAAEDAAILAGNFAVAVVTRVKLRSLLAVDPALLDAVDVLLLDAPSTDPAAANTDGIGTDILVTHARLRPNARLFGLAGPGQDAAALARRIGGALLGPSAGGSPDRSQPEGGTLPSLDAHALHLVAAGLATNGRALARALTAAGATTGDATPSVDAAIAACLDDGLLERRGKTLHCTRSGQAASALAVDLATVRDVWTVRAAAGDLPSTLETLTELCLTPAGRALAPALCPTQHSPGSIRAALLDRAGAEGVAGRPVFRWLVEDLAALEPSASAALEAAMALHSWISGEAPRRVARRHGTSVSTLTAAVRSFAWLAAAVRAIAEARKPRARYVRTRLDVLAELARTLLPDASRRVQRLLSLSTVPTAPNAPTPTRRPSTRRSAPHSPAAARPQAGSRTGKRGAMTRRPRWSPFGVIWVLEPDAARA